MNNSGFDLSKLGNWNLYTVEEIVGILNADNRKLYTLQELFEILKSQTEEKMENWNEILQSKDIKRLQKAKLALQRRLIRLDEVLQATETYDDKTRELIRSSIEMLQTVYGFNANKIHEEINKIEHMEVEELKIG